MSALLAPSALPALGGGGAARLFLAFAAAYFLSALLRGVTATLAPNFSAERKYAAAKARKRRTAPPPPSAGSADGARNALTT